MGIRGSSSDIELVRHLGTKTSKECKGLTLAQRICRHTDFFNDEALTLAVRRAHRYKAIALLYKLAEREDIPIDLVLFDLGLSRGDLQIPRDKYK